MRFLDIARSLMSLQKHVPDMHWHIEDRGEVDHIIITLPVSKEVGTLFRQGREMFS